ncbi:MAG: hypothetical protein U5K79_18990 [Cyclobacteriaceae bacterium]|nr:hypothetical protein [Cyclobacteriaceae bacterium]
MDFFTVHCDSYFFIGLDEGKSGMERYDYRVSLKKGVEPCGLLQRYSR